MKIAVIGTAGRKEDASKLNKEVYEAMYQDLLSRVSLEDTLVSGGAAYADHLAVRAYLDGHVKHLVLHMPFTTKHAKCAQVSMYYYDRMYAVTGINVRADINAAIKKGAEVTTQPDTQNYSPMANRNKLVANDGDLLIAYTFGEGDVPKDGGTEITWDMSQGKKIHVPIPLLHIDEGSYLGDTVMKLPTTVDIQKKRLDEVLFAYAELTPEYLAEIETQIQSIRLPYVMGRRRIGQYGSNYTYSGKLHKGLAIPQWMGELIQRVNNTFNTNFNSVLVNEYPAGVNTGIGLHADDEPELGTDPIVVSISLGAKEKFTLVRNGTREETSINLKQGSVVYMGRGSQIKFKHKIAYRVREQSRISLTFREFKDS